MTNTKQEKQEREPSQMLELFSLLESTKIEYFADTAEGHAYASLSENGSYYTWRVDSAEFRGYMRRLYEGKCDKIASSHSIRELQSRYTDTIIVSGNKQEVHVRSAGDRENVYIDLGDADRRCVHINKDGWQIVPHSMDMPRFRMPHSTTPLPTPVRGGHVDLLWDVLPIYERNQRAIVLGCVLSFLFPSPPSPILVVNGEAGSGKTTASRIITNLVDPITHPLPAPKKETLYLAGRGAKVICLDNVSGFKQDISDDMARLTYGAENMDRKMYTNGDIYRHRAQCGIILNGIPDFISQPDLADRCLRLHLNRLPENKHLHLSDVMRRFRDIQPRIFGALCDAISLGLQRFDETPMPDQLRLKEVAQLVEAAAPKLGLEPGEFTQAAIQSRHQLIGDSFEACPVSHALKLLLEESPGGFSLSPTELYESLKRKVKDQPGNWPQSSTAMTQTLHKNKGAIREQLGFHAEYKKSGNRSWTFTPIKQHQAAQAEAEEVYQERLAICVDSGISAAEAHRIAQAEADNCANLNGGVH